MKLVIVESPTKCNTIQRYLGDQYIVKASFGHIRDLATSGKGGLGVDIENHFTPTYNINKDKKKVVYELKELAKQAEEVILATDPDREGEAIAWHLAVVLGLDVQTNKRLEFHEITRDSITEAMKSPRTIDLNFVASQETRRILDRIIGFKLSTLVNRKIHSKSAGRVQSATLKLIADHETDIEKFVPEEYWDINVEIAHGKKHVKVNFVNDFDGNKEVKTETQAKAIIASLKDNLTIKSVDRSVRLIESKPPFTTSSMQQEAFTKLKFNTAKTSSVAQSLYEGINVNGEHVGLITYIRTDSTRLSPTFIGRAKAFIEETYGKQYIGVVKKGEKGLLAQDAHEAIRPTSNHRTPESVRQYLTPDQYNLYKLIYVRALSSLMKPKKEEVLTITLVGGDNTFKVEYSKTIFPGYEILNDKNEKQETFPEVNEGDQFEITKKECEQKFTNPPARYTEAKVVKLMEEVGIGRPSTYSSTISILKKRHYINEEKGAIICSEQGRKTSHVLNKYFPTIVDAKYTAGMESELDKIQEGEASSEEILDKFYLPFIKMVDEGYERMYVDEVVEVPDSVCPKCGKPLVYKMGKNGQFIGCSDYPRCDYVQKEKKVVEETGQTCPVCGSPLVYRNKNGKKFVACSNYPTCKYTVKEEKEIKPVKKCPHCEDGFLIKKKGRYGYFLGCTNYPKCEYMEKIHKKGHK